MTTRKTKQLEYLIKSYALVATLLVASVYTPALAKKGSVVWAMNATIIDGCSCRILCPCIFGSPATVGPSVFTS